MRRQFWRFRHDRRRHIPDGKSGVFEQLPHLLEQSETVRARQLRVGIGEVVPDIRKPRCRKEGVHDRVAQHVPVAVRAQPGRGVYFHAAQHDVFAVRAECVRIRADARAHFMHTEILRKCEFLVDRIPFEKPRRCDVLAIQARIVRKMVFGRHFAVSGEQFAEGKSLRRLYGEQPFARHACLDESALCARGGIRAGQGADGAAELPHGADAVADDPLRNEGPSAVVDEHVVGRAGERGERFERILYRLRARLSSLDKEGVRETAQFLLDRFPVRAAHADGDARDIFVAGKGRNGAGEHGLSAHPLQEFIVCKSRARAAARRGDDGINVQGSFLSEFFQKGFVVFCGFNFWNLCHFGYHLFDACKRYSAFFARKFIGCTNFINHINCLIRQESIV